MGWSRSTNEGRCRFVVGWFRDYSEFISIFAEDDVHIYLLLIVNFEEGKCHLDKELRISKNGKRHR